MPEKSELTKLTVMRAEIFPWNGSGPYREWVHEIEDAVGVRRQIICVPARIGYLSGWILGMSGGTRHRALEY